MTFRCFLSDPLGGTTPKLTRWAASLALLVVPRLAVAQEAPPPAEPTPAPSEPVPAPSAPVPATAPPAAAAEPVQPVAPTAPPTPAPTPAPAPNGVDPEDDDDGNKRHKSGKAKHEVKLKARLFALAELSHRRETVVGTDAALVERNRDALDLSLQSARIAAEYRSPLPWLAAELELELAHKPRVKDAFLEAGKHWFARIGHFKIPAAALELVSPWRVPVVHRGFVHDLLTDWMDVGERRPGVAFGYRGQGDLKPRLTLGAFQGTTLKQVAPADRDTQLIDHASLEAQTFAARGEVTLGGVALGAWYEQRVGSRAVAQTAHYATFGLDATTDKRLGPGALRFWLDGMGGQSFYVAGTDRGDNPKPWFAAARALVAYRFGGVEAGEAYVEPFGFFAALDPDADITSDATTEVAVGLAGGFWDRARLTLQAETTHAQRNFPGDLLDHQEPDHESLLLQAGARF
jgi:hypothetical protein